MVREFAETPERNLFTKIVGYLHGLRLAAFGVASSAVVVYLVRSLACYCKGDPLKSRLVFNVRVADFIN